MRLADLGRSLRDRVLGVGVGVKIMGIALGVVALIAFAGVLNMRRNMARIWRDHLHSTGIWMGRVLAEVSLESVLTNDTAHLHEFLVEILRDNPDVRYLMIADADDRIVAHTFPHPVSSGLAAANRVAPGQLWRLQGLSTEEGVLWDVAVPMLAGRAGTVRVGLSERSMHSGVAANLQSMLLVFVLISGIAVLGALGLTHILTRRLQRLVKITDRVAQGDFSQKAPVAWMDEVGELAAAFNHMTDRLGRAHQELHRKEQMRVRLLNQVMTAQEEERGRVARELHDHTGQAITSLMIGLRTVAEADTVDIARERLEEVRALAEGTLDEVRNLAWELRPSVLDDHGLIIALERYLQHCREHYQLDIDWHAVCMEGQRLPAGIETALYRIIQEAMINVVRHAGAQRVSVVLACRGNEIVAIVEDDGIGFDWEALQHNPSGSLGLYGIEERASLVGGSLSIESATAGGTAIVVRIPL